MPIQEDSNEQIEREKRMAANMDGIYVNQKLIYVDADLWADAQAWICAPL